ncbi:hypothetical protein FRB94_002851 [Tulasnella sp. JGI-2019a]|nr:hypothetical protein FRB94_002851 [Tulasnella sp. JGI-2019a]
MPASNNNPFGNFGKKKKNAKGTWEEISRLDAEVNTRCSGDDQSFSKRTPSVDPSPAILVARAPDPNVTDVQLLSNTKLTIGSETAHELTGILVSQPLSKSFDQDYSCSNLLQVDPTALRAAWDPAMKMFISQGEEPTADGEVIASITDNEILDMSREVAARRLHVQRLNPQAEHEKALLPLGPSQAGPGESTVVATLDSGLAHDKTSLDPANTIREPSQTITPQPSQSMQPRISTSHEPTPIDVNGVSPAQPTVANIPEYDERNNGKRTSFTSTMNDGRGVNNNGPNARNPKSYFAITEESDRTNELGPSMDNMSDQVFSVNQVAAVQAEATNDVDHQEGSLEWGDLMDTLWRDTRLDEAPPIWPRQKGSFVGQ